MTHRERVQAVLDRREPDRVPIDLWCTASRICNQLYFEIVRRQGWTELGECVKASRSGDYVDYRVSDLIDADFRHTNIGHPGAFKAHIDPEGNTIGEWGYGTRVVNDLPIVTYCPLGEAEISDIARHPWPKVEDPGRVAGLELQVRTWQETTDYAITSTSAVSGLMLDICPYLRGFEKFYMDFYLEPAFAHALIEKVTDVIIEMYQYYLKPIGRNLAWVELSSDHGMQDRPLISRDTYRTFFKAPYRRLFDSIRAVAPQARLFMHCCGSVRELIPEFIDIGLDILNALQPKAAGMNSFELKREFGKDLIFHGGLDIQGGINGAVEDAVREAKTRLRAFAPGGGYIFAPANHFMQDVPIDNFFAIYETARAFGRYPLAIDQGA
jgi:uroporphyrinogen decarboxylase